MQPIFGITREQENELAIHDYKILSSTFHFHSTIEIILVREGRVDVCIGDKSKVISAGEIAVATSFEPHTFNNLTDCLATILFIPTYLCEDFLVAMKNKRLTDPFFFGEIAEKMRASFDALLDPTLENLEKLGYVYLILGAALKNARLAETRDASDADLGSKLLFYINENFKDDITLESIATSLGYSSNYISKHFRASFNVGIKQYITTVRLKNAVMLLRDQKSGVTECAFESGFSSVRSFYRAFSAEFGCSPREYLRREGI